MCIKSNTAPQEAFIFGDAFGGYEVTCNRYVKMTGFGVADGFSASLTALQTEALREYFRAEFAKEPVVPAQGAYYVSVDGAGAPRVAHATVEDAQTEATRMAKSQPGKTVRVLQQVDARVAQVSVEVKLL